MRPRATLFAGALALYCATLAPSLDWADAGRMQLDVVLGGSNYWFLPELSHAPMDGGPFARLGVTPWDHPLYIVLARGALLVPLGSPGLRLNLFSALIAALAVALAYPLARRLGADRTGAALGALALAVSHTFWWHAVTTEVLALHCLFMIAVISLSLRWLEHRRVTDLRWLAFISGLGLANHVMLVLTLIPTAGYLIWEGGGTRRPTMMQTTAVIGAFLAGFAPWWIQFLRVARVIGLGPAFTAATWLPALPDDTVAHALAAVAINIVHYAGYLLYQFTPLGVALGILGFATLRKTRPEAATYLAWLFGTHVAFSLNFPFEDRFAFHLPSYLVFALCIGVGATRAIATVQSGTRRVATLAALGAAVVIAPIALYQAAPSALRAAGIDDADLGIPDIGPGGRARDGLAYFLNPNKHGDHSAERFARATLAKLKANAVVIAPRPDLEVSMVLRYVQVVEGVRPDVYVDPLGFVAMPLMPHVLAVKARTVSPCRPFYVPTMTARAYSAEMRREFRVFPDANLYRVQPRHPSAGTCAEPYQPQTLAQVIDAVLR